MKLKREELKQFEENWLKEHPKQYNSPNEYISFLDGLNKIILQHEYEIDENFFTYCRRDFLRQEFSDYLNGKAHSVLGKYNDAFNNLSEYYSGDTWIFLKPTGIPKDKNAREIIDKSIKYEKSGIICKQEIEIINDMIEEFKTHLNKE